MKWGKALVQACKDYREADAKVDEMIVRIEVCWMRVLSQLEVTKELESTMTDDHKAIQQRTLCILRGKLDSATHNLSKFSRRPVLEMVKKLQFVRLKDTLEETIAELESWQRLYEPSWFHLIKYAPPTVDVTLNNVIKTGPTGAADFSLVARKFRRACHFVLHALIATRPGDSRRLIVDIVTNGAVQSKDAREFARRLRDSDPFTFGVFSCKGVVRQGKTSGMAFLFRVPEGYTAIRSVRQLLLSGQAHDSLSDRLEMAKKLVNAVYYVHLYGFVHKNIRPETILSLSETEDGRLSRMACLVGFQVIRNADGRTYPMTDIKWETNLYRHPLRQGNNVDYYVMQHDIYSLGVCLLEIGLWESLVAYDPDGAAQPSTALSLAEDMSQLNNPDILKEHLVTLSRSKMLRAKMGTKYSEVVETCLTCLDEDNLDFGDEREFQDEDGVAVVVSNGAITEAEFGGASICCAARADLLVAQVYEGGHGRKNISFLKAQETSPLRGPPVHFGIGLRNKALAL
ncbi:hypothetical protein G7Z17_g1601 [Cylindrodendrum hubeiense]|uniref:Protein kinase domain-containing protein n=1 Tax=Cylindrodendrum hubeiense TaxID=595255 RepID=A0A9P5HEK5_9HYPO|nr:hypothetical protein G7Z17_g1601 [Cylindrodendrum hubeiense]